MSDSLRPHGLYGPWNSPGQNTGLGSLSLLQGTFPTQGSNPGLPHCRHILYQLSHKGSPWETQNSQAKFYLHPKTMAPPSLWFWFSALVLGQWKHNESLLNGLMELYCQEKKKKSLICQTKWTCNCSTPKGSAWSLNLCHQKTAAREVRFPEDLSPPPIGQVALDRTGAALRLCRELTRSQSSRTCSSCPARRAKDSRPLATVRSFPAAFPKLELFGFYLWFFSRREFSLQSSQGNSWVEPLDELFPTQEDVRLELRQSARHHIMSVYSCPGSSLWGLRVKREQLREVAAESRSPPFFVSCLLLEIFFPTCVKKNTNWTRRSCK